MADIVKIQLNTGKVIEAQRSAIDIVEDLNNWDVMVDIWEGDYILANTILRIETFKETSTLWVEVEAKNDEEADKKEYER